MKDTTLIGINDKKYLFLFLWKIEDRYILKGRVLRSAPGDIYYYMTRWTSLLSGGTDHYIIYNIHIILLQVLL